MKRDIFSPYANPDWTWLIDMPWFSKLPKYKQSVLWNFVFHRLNDLCMLMYHNDGVFPKIKQIAYRVIAEQNGRLIDEVSPETIGTGFRSSNPNPTSIYEGTGCSDVYWAPILLSCYDSYHNSKTIVDLPEWAIKEIKEVKP
jgi:hypothetical protein